MSQTSLFEYERETIPEQIEQIQREARRTIRKQEGGLDA